MQWEIPERDVTSHRDILREWDTKHERVLSYVKNRDTVIQAGGCCGVFPYNLAKHFNNVWTYEPSTENWDCLVKNLCEVKNVYKTNKALSNEKSYVKVSSTLKGNVGATQVSHCENGTIESTTIDSTPLKKVDLLWLDLEGFEWKALQGAKQTITKHRPVIVVENNGLIHEYKSTKQGSQEFRKIFTETFNYIYVERLMRDDVFIPKENV